MTVFDHLIYQRIVYLYDERAATKQVSWGNYQMIQKVTDGYVLIICVQLQKDLRVTPRIFVAVNKDNY